METKNPKTSLAVGGRHNWHEEFGLPPRFPRGIPIDEIKECMRSIGEPEIFLQELDDHVEIVIRLDKPSNILPKETWKVLEEDGVTLPRVFDSLLWQKLDGDRSDIWVELADVARESYRQLWFEFFKKGYVGISHPAFDQGLVKLLSEMGSEGKINPRRGPHSVPKAQIASIRKRYEELLPICVKVHRAVESAIRSVRVKKGGKNPTPAEVRKATFENTRKSLQGLQLFGRIFDGQAFREHWCGLKHAHLHDPDSWKPRNLARSLLAFERKQKWETLEKKLRPQKATVPTSSLIRI